MVYDAVENPFRDGRVADLLVPFRNRHLRSRISDRVWCGPEVLDLHTVTGTCTSSMRVCQFRRDRTQASLSQLALKTRKLKLIFNVRWHRVAS